MILGHNAIKRMIEEKKLVITPMHEDTIRECGVDLRLYSDIAIPPLTHRNLWTMEWIELPIDLMGFCNLRSTYARKGLIIPSTVIDPCFVGHLVIEVFNANAHEVKLNTGERFLHVVFARVEDAIPYFGQYQYQKPVKF